MCSDPGWFNCPSHRQGYGHDLQNMDMVLLILTLCRHMTLVIAGVILVPINNTGGQFTCEQAAQSSTPSSLLSILLSSSLPSPAAPVFNIL